MADFMKPYSGQTYAVLRIVAGLLFFVHGSSKIFGFPTAVPDGTPAFIVWVAGGIELVGGLLIAIGLFTRWAAFLSSGLMAAAYWMAHGASGFGAHGMKAIFPSVNGGELAVIYCFLFLFIAAHGAGRWSVDARGSA